MELWAESGEPTPAARLAQARALIQFGLMDRAWSRLQDLLDAKKGGVEALVVTARMFLERGWSQHARRALQQALADHPDDPELNTLWDKTSEPPTQPDLDAAELEGADAQVLLSVAEHHIAMGSFVKARSLIERVRKVSPEHSRAADLLWALEGDFSLEGQTLAEVADRFGPDLSALADLPDEAEHTAEIDLATGKPRDIGEGSSSSFPALFRNMEPRTEVYQVIEDSEVTQLTSLAAIEELRNTPAPAFGGGADDTQIVRVVHRNGPRATADVETGSFDLAAFRREMGMQYAPSTDYVDAPEEEDDDVIFMTRREDSPEVTEVTAVGGGLQLQPEEDQVDAGRHELVNEDAEWMRPAPDAPAEEPSPQPAQEEKPPVAKAPTPPPAPRPDASWPWWVAAFVGALVLTVGLGAVIVLAQILNSMLS